MTSIYAFDEIMAQAFQRFTGSESLYDLGYKAQNRPQDLTRAEAFEAGYLFESIRQHYLRLRDTDGVDHVFLKEAENFRDHILRTLGGL